MAIALAGNLVVAQFANSEEPVDPVVAQLRTQIDVMERYNDQLLATVYWSLGVLVTIAGVLIGFGWFANFRIYQRDKASLSAELAGGLQASVSQAELRLSTDLAKRFSELSEATNRTVRQEIESTQRQVQSLSQSVDYRFTEIAYESSDAESRRWISSLPTPCALSSTCLSTP